MDKLTQASNPQPLPFGRTILYSVSRPKNTRVALTLALTLGGLGAHKFYQQRFKEGVLYLLFCWTLIPTLFAFIDLFFIPLQIRLNNLAIELQPLVKVTPEKAQIIAALRERQAANDNLEIVLKILFGILFAWLVYVSFASLRDKPKFQQLEQDIRQLRSWANGKAYSMLAKLEQYPIPISEFLNSDS